MENASPTDRIDAALNRIEHAVETRERQTRELGRRHEALRTRVGEAVAALDALGAKNG